MKFSRRQVFVVLCFLAAAGLSWSTYFRNYAYPPHFYWDENYHVASAQKYLNGTFFMELHPPLGKLLIALGEFLLQPNADTAQFQDTMYAKIETDGGFSFAGYRLFPALLAWWTAPLLYLVFLVLLKSPWPALLFSFMYIFDNALIVHGRGAMLEGPQLFFIALTLLLFLLLRVPGLSSPALAFRSVLFGISLGAVWSIKLNGVILAVLPAAFLLENVRNRRRAFFFAAPCAAGALGIFLLTWFVHFSIARTPNPRLEHNGFFKSSPSGIVQISSGRSTSLTGFPVVLGDALNYSLQYNESVPVLNICKPDENGSPAFLWPLGSFSINYRWEKNNEGTRYLYLQSNPVVWWAALAGVLLAAAWMAAQLMYPAMLPAIRDGRLLLTFLTGYFGYLAWMSLVSRVMYLYHYFLALIFAFAISALVWKNLRRLGGRPLRERRKVLLLSCYAAAVVAAFFYFKPLTYYEPLSDKDISRLGWFSLWDLRCTDCQRLNPLGAPLPRENRPFERTENLWRLNLSGVQAAEIFQDWGDPRENRTVVGGPLLAGGRTFKQGFGVHAFSRLVFPLNGRFRTFSAYPGLPDTLEGMSASVQFRVVGDDRVLWQSAVVFPGMKPEKIEVDVTGVQKLSLEVYDAGDGITHDHACWFEPELQPERGG